MYSYLYNSQDGYFFNITVKSLGKFFKKDFYVVIYICRYILKAKKKGRYSRFLPKTLSDFQYQGVVVEV